MKRPLVFLTFAFLMAGCQNQQSLLSSSVDRDLDLVCRANRVVNVIHTPGALIMVGQPYIEVCPGRTITVQIRPPAAGGTEAKPEAADDWRSGTADANGNIVLNVPEDIAPGEYRYAVIIDDTGTIDPIFRIIE